MLGNHGRSFAQMVFDPLAALLEKLHVTPNMVTVAGSVINSMLAVTLIARGHLIAGPLALGVVLFMDSVDGILARRTGGTTKFGEFLDSTMDRIVDGFVFGSLLYWVIFGMTDGPWRTTAIIAGIVSMTAIGVVPYVRAKAEIVGVVAKVGIAERTDRLIIALTGAFITGWGASPWFYAAGLVWVAFASSVTALQRILVVRKGLLKA